jgi:hypothetical protein
LWIAGQTMAEDVGLDESERAAVNSARQSSRAANSS